MEMIIDESSERLPPPTMKNIFRYTQSFAAAERVPL